MKHVGMPERHLPFPVKDEEYIGKHHRLAMGQDRDQEVKREAPEADSLVQGKGTLHLPAKGRGKAEDNSTHGLEHGPPKC